MLPGLIDCHVHLTGQLGPGQRLRVRRGLRSEGGAGRGVPGAADARAPASPRCATSARASRRSSMRCARRWPRARFPARASSASARSCRPPAATARPTAFARTSACACSPTPGSATGSTAAGARCACRWRRAPTRSSSPPPAGCSPTSAPASTSSSPPTSSPPSSRPPTCWAAGSRPTRTAWRASTRRWPPGSTRSSTAASSTRPRSRCS